MSQRVEFPCKAQAKAGPGGMIAVEGCQLIARNEAAMNDGVPIVNPADGSGDCLSVRAMFSRKVQVGDICSACPVYYR
jgi:hypothetical protein